MRLVIFGDSSSGLSLELVAAAVRAAHARADVDLVAICDTSQVAPSSLRDLGRGLLVALVKRAFGGPAVLQATLRRFRGLRVPSGASVILPARDVNHPQFVALVKRELRPTAALCLSSHQIFGGELLAALGRPTNYHSGLLPAYRGLRSTAWSHYQGESVTGFTYHVMEEGIDTGPILVQGAIPILPKATERELVREKTRLAINLMPAVLDALVRGDTGRPQTGTPSYFGARDALRVTSIDDPGVLSWEELERRLRAFTLLTISIHGEPYAVTRLRRVDSGHPHRPELAFTTADGVLAEPSRCRYLPVSLYRAYRRAPLRTTIILVGMTTIMLAGESA